MTERGYQELLAEAAQGSHEALGALMARHLPMLRSYVRLRMGPLLAAREAPSDIVQSACLEILQDLSRQEFRSEGHLRHALVQAAGRKLLDRARYHGAEKRDGGRDASLGSSEIDGDVLAAYQTLTPSSLAIGHELAELLERAFAALDDDEREMIVMAKIIGLSRGEIAEQLGIGVVAVRTRLYRALNRLAVLVDAGGSGAN